MKRSGFKARKSPLRAKTPLRGAQRLRKASKQPISKLQRDIWAEVKRITRTRYPNVCYTCDRKDLAGANWHSGHMWPKAALGAYMKYDLRIIRPQCYFCNVNLGGRGADFYAKMLAEIGPEAMAALEADRQKQTRAYDHYTALLEAYRALC